MDLNKTGLFISALRKQKDMTQKDLAERIGVTDKAVSRWETGKGFPDVSLLTTLAGTLGVSVSEIVMGEKIDIKEEKAIEIMDKTVKDTLDYSQREVSKSMRWKYIAIASFIFMLGIAVIIISNSAIDMGLSWFVIPVNAILFVWLIVTLVILIMRKSKILTLLLCGFAIFAMTYYYSSLNEAPTRDFSNFAVDGFIKAYLPHYTIIVVLLLISLALGIMSFLIQKKKISSNLLFSLLSIGITVIIISVITASSIIEYVDLNGYGVNGSYTMLLLFSGIVTCVSLALIVRKFIPSRKVKDKT